MLICLFVDLVLIGLLCLQLAGFAAVCVLVMGCLWALTFDLFGCVTCRGCYWLWISVTMLGLTELFDKLLFLCRL